METYKVVRSSPTTVTFGKEDVKYIVSIDRCTAVPPPLVVTRNPAPLSTAPTDL